jgi:hypothetical protein
MTTMLMPLRQFMAISLLLFLPVMIMMMAVVLLRLLLVVPHWIMPYAAFSAYRGCFLPCEPLPA